MSVCCSLPRLCANNPAPTSSTTDNAACTTTSPRCSSEAPPVVVRVPYVAHPPVVPSHLSAPGPRQTARLSAIATPHRKPQHLHRRAGTDRHMLIARKRQHQQHPRSAVGHRQCRHSADSPPAARSPSAAAAQSCVRIAPNAVRTLISVFRCHSTHQQKVRNVGARNHQHQPGDPH